MTVHCEIAGGVALITIDNPPLNVLGQATRAGLDAAIIQAVEAGVGRIILTGAGRAFVAGADAKEFDGPPLAPHLNEILARLAALSIPTVAAINGIALGGGCEIALACRYRIAAPSAGLGLPEVTLGIVPGSGGTQRLPRLTGIAAAVDLIGQGRSVKAAEALDLGMIDAIAEDPVAAAKALDEATLRGALVADVRPAPEADAAAIEAARGLVARRMPGQTAPPIAIGLVEAAAEHPLEANLAAERKAFLDLRGADQSRALRHIFFAERAALSAGKAFPAPVGAIETAIVVGGGNMGAAIAYTLASSGIHVTVVETDAAGQVRAQANVDGLVQQGVKRGALSADAAARIAARLTCVAGFDALPQVDLAIEAAFEDMEVKRGIFATLQASQPETTVLATNTSYLDVNRLADGIRDPGRFLGLHFFSPAHIMKLLEIVRGERTSAETLGVAFALAKRLGKMPVLAGVCDGFIGNRILTRYRQVADILLIEGALPGQVDAAMRGFGMAMGPYAAQDMSGLDIAYANRKRQNLKDRTDIRHVPVADTLVEDMKRLGRKSGAGWYDYDDKARPMPSAAVEKVILEASAGAGVTRRSFAPEDISGRILLAMIAEAADILDEGIAARPRDIDIVLVHGYGFPRWRGGLLHYADTLGTAAILRRIEELAVTDPLTWRVPPLVRRLADTGTAFADLND
ncbi:FAD-dependent oxidoreductase [Pseudogemmobacter sonorensis]|uniref:FAD-dependent oxidoreductase n=1 Tax=Pseudogemmobacter sonorensis TaxID=2989681 RepID=UPI0036C0CB3C